MPCSARILCADVHELLDAPMDSKPPLSVQVLDVKGAPDIGPDGTAENPFGSLDMAEIMRDLSGDDVKHKWDDIKALRDQAASHARFAKSAESSEPLQLMTSSWIVNSESRVSAVSWIFDWSTCFSHSCTRAACTRVHALTFIHVVVC